MSGAHPPRLDGNDTMEVGISGTRWQDAAAAVTMAALVAWTGTCGAQSMGGGGPPPTYPPPAAPVYSQPAAPPAPGSAGAATCATCGTVESIRYVEQKGEASGVGAVAGGVLGGVLGHQLGSGRGNTVATIAGVGAGAYAGNQVEKHRNKRSYWTVALRMDDGRTRALTYGTRPTVNQGDRVKLVDGGKRLAPLGS